MFTIDPEQLDRVAEQMRIAYGERVGGTMQLHIENHPWSSIGDARKQKWLAMAETAWVTIEIIKSEGI